MFYFERKNEVLYPPSGKLNTDKFFFALIKSFQKQRKKSGKKKADKGEWVDHEGKDQGMQTDLGRQLASGSCWSEGVWIRLYTINGGDKRIGVNQGTKGQGVERDEGWDMDYYSNVEM